MNNINQEGRSEESFAKKILEKNPLAQRYGNIIEMDKPDLWALEMNIGIEVTQATDQLTCEIHGLWAKGMNSNCSKTIAKCEEKIKIYNELHKVPEFPQRWTVSPRSSYKIEQNNFLCGSFIYDSYQFEGTPEEWIIFAAEKKVKKLNEKIYRKFAKYDLFVCFFRPLRKEIIPNIAVALKKINTGDITYSRIYVVSLESIFVFDFIQNEVHVEEHDLKLLCS